MNNIIVYCIKEAKGSNQLDRQTEDINQLQKSSRNIVKSTLEKSMLGK